MRQHRKVLTGSLLGARVGQWMQRSLIKSIQRGTITLADGQATNTATITSVTTSRAHVRWLGFNVAAPTSSQGEAMAHVVLTNATTVTATRASGGSPAAALIVSYEVVEYVPGVLRGIQTGTVTIANGNTGGTATVTSVNTSKTQLILNGWLNNPGAVVSESIFAHLVLTNATTITATRIGTGGVWTAAFTLLEFD